MRFNITHTTTYHYSQPVGLCQNEARLQPREFWRQQCVSSRFELSPEPSDFKERTDFFGNRVAYFAIQQSHAKLTVTALSDVIINSGLQHQNPISSITWEEARSILQSPFIQAQSQVRSLAQAYWAEDNFELMDARQYLLDSPMVVSSGDLAGYAGASFLPNRPLIDAVADLMRRIYNDFTYDPAFTTIATPLSDVLSHRRGVCQDFAHLAIGCLRSYGLAARYVSGYIESTPMPGAQRLVGADASHAWFAVYIPGTGWCEFDPTNNKMPTDQHITLAWGRDYSDVTPLKGVAYGGGQHTLLVSVDVMRVS
ncbi:MAG: transglutaminase family protein [Methylicorpusculum sp.]|nr:transglutaminase family protein [Methylicorpusculum sp.]